MATANSTAAPSSTNQEQPTRRRYLAPNVICMFAEDRQPVLNRPRRGRFPKVVTPILASGKRIFPGVICELRTPLNPQGVPVLVEELDEEGLWSVVALGGHEIVCRDGSTYGRARAESKVLFRSASVAARYQR